MASPQVYLNLAKGYFQRNNPIEMIVMNVIQSVYSLVTLQSRRKILDYRKMLEFQKLKRIEQTLSEFNPYEHVGTKINRPF